MGKLEVHAGDFGETSVLRQCIVSPLFRSMTMPNGYHMDFRDLDTVEIATEESARKVGGMIGWGAAGAFALGPVGLLAGLLVGSRGKKEVTFIAKTKGGKKFMATCSNKDYVKIKAAVF